MALKTTGDWNVRAPRAPAFLLPFLILRTAAAWPQRRPFGPNLLVSTTDPARNITIHNAHSGEHSLEVGLVWWTLGMAVATGYFVFVYRMFRGKIAPGGDGHGY